MWTAVHLLVPAPLSPSLSLKTMTNERRLLAMMTNQSRVITSPGHMSSWWALDTWSPSSRWLGTLGSSLSVLETRLRNADKVRSPRNGGGRWGWSWSGRGWSPWWWWGVLGLRLRSTGSTWSGAVMDEVFDRIPKNIYILEGVTNTGLPTQHCSVMSSSSGPGPYQVKVR